MGGVLSEAVTSFAALLAALSFVDSAAYEEPNPATQIGRNPTNRCSAWRSTAQQSLLLG